MPMLTIYQYPRSPFCIAVMQALTAAGIPYAAVEVPTGDRSAIIKRTNGAYYQVPLLEDGDRLIYESGADTQDIAEYIDEHYTGHRLFPAASRGWQAIANRYIENDVEEVTFKVCDAVCIPPIEDVVERTMQIRHKERKFGPGCVTRWMQERPAMIEEATRLLRPFDQVLGTGEHPFLLGALPVYTDFLLFGILGNFTYQGTASLPADLGALRQWYERLQVFRY
jgi:glutathione S-transferase